MTTKKILALPFPFVIHPWGRFHFFLLVIGLHRTKIQRPRWNIFISVAYLRCVPLSQFLVNGQQWERYVTTHPNPSPRKKKGWQLSCGGPGYSPSWSEDSWRCLRVLCTNMEDQKKEIVSLWIPKMSDNNNLQNLVKSMSRDCSRLLRERGSRQSIYIVL